MDEEIIILFALILLVLGLLYVGIYLLIDWIKEKWRKLRNVKSAVAPTKP